MTQNSFKFRNGITNRRVEYKVGDTVLVSNHDKPAKVMGFEERDCGDEEDDRNGLLIISLDDSTWAYAEDVIEVVRRG